ncbi:MAG: sugar phosphate isomerase/epimerase family protein [Candidatus Lernaella stagnicola]|nr:sugar phosphate isomerase/epimerase family protein [Candidatus Lernaella stagnicola]
MEPSISTHLFVFDRLRREHLAHVAAAGFGTIELWAAGHHFPYEDDAAVAELRGWLADLHLRVGSIHLPFYVDFGSPDFRFISFAAPDQDVREVMTAKTKRLLEVATSLGCRFFVLHPTATFKRDGSNRRRLHAALDWLVPACEKRGQTILLENIMMPESRTALLADTCRAYGEATGICLDTGHAHIDGGLLVELAAAAPHLRALHVHDNFGIDDDHLPPGEGNIDWPATLSTLRMNAPHVNLFTFELSGPSGDTPDATAKRHARLESVKTFWQTHAEDLA